jgi:hypothetical protein
MGITSRVALELVTGASATAERTDRATARSHLKMATGRKNLHTRGHPTRRAWILASICARGRGRGQRAVPNGQIYVTPRCYVSISIANHTHDTSLYS